MLGSPALGTITATAEPPSLHLNDPPKQLRKASCGCCPARLKLTDLACGKCKARFCMTHRLPEAHKCGFDFKGEGAKILESKNPLVVGSKLEKI